MVSGGEMKREQVTVRTLQEKKRAGRKISMVTAYDYPFGDLADRAGIDCILVGDSLGIVVQGHETTIPVTMDQMIYHTSLVSRAVRRALVIGDMPFLSYRTPEIAVANAAVDVLVTLAIAATIISAVYILMPVSQTVAHF